MKKLFIKYYVCFFVLMNAFTISGNAQELPATFPVLVEQQLENLTENNSDVETEDDSYLQELQHFLKEPMNINAATESDLIELKVLTALQIQNLISYRKLLGNFINIYELQAVPGWNVSLLRRLKYYITVSSTASPLQSFAMRLRNGENSLLTRVTQVLEKSKGYRSDSSSTNFYDGSPQKIFTRYKYVYKNLLQYGITAEKDAGEQFFKGKQKYGFDFYSAHFFAKNIGKIKSLAIGDFTVNMGQGLIQWQSLAFKKSSDVLNIKRQSDILHPYNSPGEIIFHRGIGITIQNKTLETTGFISYRHLDANFMNDTINNEFVSSLQSSGYHRTNSEIADKNIQGQLTIGGNISYSKNKLHVGINGVQYYFRYPLIKAANLYNEFAINGDRLTNYSVDYSYTYKNIHFFGEAAGDNNFNKAFVNGLLLSTDAKIDMSILYRKIAKEYQSLYANAFTESTFPVNENGLYTGISILPFDNIKVDAYMDMYNFPWLKYRVDAPSAGNDYLIQITYKPNKEVEMYSTYHSEKKAINDNPADITLNPVVIKPKQSWRTQVNFKLNSVLSCRSRIEMTWYDKNGEEKETGFLAYTDLLYKSLSTPFSANMRFQYFETDGYNSRMYAYENDVLYSFSIPVFYGKGYRYYINFNYSYSKRLSFWARFAQTYYPDKSIIGTGLDEIKGHLKTELKIECVFDF